MVGSSNRSSRRLAPARLTRLTRLTQLTLLLLLSPAAGCSWIFTEGPPANHATLPYFNCSTSYAPPVLDTIWGGLNATAVLLSLSQVERTRSSSTGSSDHPACAQARAAACSSGSPATARAPGARAAARVTAISSSLSATARAPCAPAAAGLDFAG
jgi:hypothetical protein